MNPRAGEHQPSKSVFQQVDQNTMIARLEHSPIDDAETSYFTHLDGGDRPRAVDVVREGISIFTGVDCPAGKARGASWTEVGVDAPPQLASEDLGLLRTVPHADRLDSATADRQAFILFGPEPPLTDT